jgi:hypothetical protein
MPSAESIHHQQYKLVDGLAEKGYVQLAISHVVGQKVHEKPPERLRITELQPIKKLSGLLGICSFMTRCVSTGRG